jgi:hypothetical protein
MALRQIQALSPSRQVRFHQLLIAARKTVLGDALGETLASLDPNELKLQLGTLVPKDVQQALAASGVRDEYVFPTPIVLQAQPNLIGYYRLLLGISQKAFYATGTGRGHFKSMEERGVIGPSQKLNLAELCKVMAEALADLVRQMSPRSPKEI